MEKSKMTKNISEAAPFVKVFDGVESIKKDQIKDTDIEILAYSIKNGTDGKFAVALIEVDKKQYTTTFSEILISRLETALENVGEDGSKGNESEFYFTEAIGAKLVMKDSNKSKFSYWDLV